MDSTVTGDTKPEEKPDEGASEKRPPEKRNWTLIALIAVSCVAVLLLATMVSLAVTVGVDHQCGHEKFERPGGWDMGPMQRRGDGRRRDQFPQQPENSATQNPQAQPNTPQQTQPVPAPGQGP